MEAPEDVMGGSHSSSSTGTATVLKRKRSKRPAPPPRALPPLHAAASSSSASSTDDHVSEEEEDMAHCLILLAQGSAFVASDDPSPSPPPAAAEKFTSRRFTEAATTAGGKAGFYVYECKTCNKCFPSFQALGGHRASHKKPKLQQLPPPSPSTNDDGLFADVAPLEIYAVSTKPASAAAAGSPTSKTRVHECSICGAEFSSGQALGGHMRRHRPIGAPQSPPATQEPMAAVVKKERNVLSLDLNLPAPAEENPQLPSTPPVAAFPFAEKRPMVFSAASAAALVDCHY